MVGYDEDKDVAVLKLDPKDMVRPLPSPLLLTQRHAHCSLLQAPGCIGPAITVRWQAAAVACLSCF